MHQHRVELGTDLTHEDMIPCAVKTADRGPRLRKSSLICLRSWGGIRRATPARAAQQLPANANAANSLVFKFRSRIDLLSRLFLHTWHMFTITAITRSKCVVKIGPYDNNTRNTCRFENPAPQATHDVQRYCRVQQYVPFSHPPTKPTRVTRNVCAFQCAKRLAWVIAGILPY